MNCVLSRMSVKFHWLFALLTPGKSDIRLKLFFFYFLKYKSKQLLSIFDTHKKKITRSVRVDNFIPLEFEIVSVTYTRSEQTSGTPYPTVGRKTKQIRHCNKQ